MTQFKTHSRLEFLILLVAVLLLGLDGLFPACRSSTANTYYVSPGEDIKSALQRLRPGDTLLFRGGEYHLTQGSLYISPDNGYSDGTEAAPIVLQAYPGERPVIVTEYINRSNRSFNFYPPEALTPGAGSINWWSIDGLTFRPKETVAISLGLHTGLGHARTFVAQHITIRNCTFENGNLSGIALNNAHDILIENCHFDNLRPRIPFVSTGGYEVNAIDVKYVGSHITIRNNRFEDIGSDGVHLGAQSYLAGSDIHKVDIVDNQFWVNRGVNGQHIYRDIDGLVVPDLQALGNVGENGIDIKQVAQSCTAADFDDCRILVAGNQVRGFRPTHPNQDASGAMGEGMIIQNNAKNIVVERNYLTDNTENLVVSTDTSKVEWGTAKIIIRNNIIHGARDFAGYPDAGGAKAQRGRGLRFDKVKDIAVYNNTLVDNQSYALLSWGAGLDAEIIDFRNNLVAGGMVSLNSESQAWSADYNLWSNLSGGLPFQLTGPNDIRTPDPRLDPVAFQLYPDSPAVNSGADLTTRGVLADYAGLARPQGAAFDIGAFELPAALIPTPTPTSPPTSRNVVWLPVTFG